MAFLISLPLKEIDKRLGRCKAWWDLLMVAVVYDYPQD